jgi:YHS domain-containing protein
VRYRVLRTKLEGVSSLAQDPVCGMQVKEDQAVASTRHMGQTYYFCSTACKAEFEKNPGRYAKQHTGHEDHHHGHGHSHCS